MEIALIITRQAGARAPNRSIRKHNLRTVVGAHIHTIPGRGTQQLQRGSIGDELTPAIHVDIVAGAPVCNQRHALAKGEGIPIVHRN